MSEQQCGNCKHMHALSSLYDRGICDVPAPAWAEYYMPEFYSSYVMGDFGDGCECWLAREEQGAV